MFDDALAALSQIFTRPFRAVMLKSLALTFALLGLAFIGFETGLETLFASSISFPYAWIASAVTVLGGIGLFVGLAFLVAPISFVVAGFFFDELAEVVERDLYPHGPWGRPLPVLDSLIVALRFAAVSVVVNLLALALWLVPGVGALAFFGANAYLLGRGTFELAALRFVPNAEVRHLRERYAVSLFLAGLVMAGFSAIPVLNLVAPLFFPAFMVRVTNGLLRPRPKPSIRRPR